MFAGSNVGVVDSLIFGTLVVISLGTGVYHAWRGRNDQTPSNFMLGNRRLSSIPVGLSLMVSFQSAIMMQGLPTEVYLHGAQWWMAVVGDFFVDTVVALAVVPFVHNLKMTSTNEYLEKRYKSRFLRLLVSTADNIGSLRYFGMATFAPALALEAAFGLPFAVSVVVIAMSTIIYTIMGGLRAVVWTDVLQAIVMCTSILALIIQGTIKAGGSSYVLRIASETGRLNIFDFDTDPTKRHTFWSLFIGTVIMGAPSPFGQVTFQRISSVPTVKEAKLMYFVNGATTFVLCTLALAEGLVIYAYYHSVGCDPYASKQISNPNQVVPLIWTEIFSGIPGLPGLFLAGIIAASLSTLSSLLNSMSVLIWEDFIKTRIRPTTNKRATVIIRLIAAVIGVIGMFLPFLLRNVRGSLSQVAVLIRSTLNISNGIFVLGYLCPWANTKGAIIGSVTAAAMTSWLTMGKLVSSGVRTTAPLPSAPVNQCPGNMLTNLSSSLEWNYTVNEYSWINSTTLATNDTAHVIQGGSLYGLNYLYSISYRWLLPINIILAVTVGSIASYITGSRELKEEDRKFILPIYETIFGKWPAFARRIWPCCAKYFIPTTPLTEQKERKRLMEVDISRWQRGEKIKTSDGDREQLEFLSININNEKEIPLI